VLPQSRVRVLTEMQAPIGELEEMVEEAEALPAAMPELQGLKARAYGLLAC
jgi:hypothetical protein